MTRSTIKEGSDCTNLFELAFNNRYTWGDNFPGYKGKCIFQSGGNIHEGNFILHKDLKVSVDGVKSDKIQKQIESQLWEVAIHRIRRTFTSVHGSNTFLAGKVNELGQEVLIGGKNKGDKYIIKDNIIKMVYRHIHGKLIKIYTTDTIDTGDGYLSNKYNSQYLDPSSNKPISQVSFFKDDFEPINCNGTWVLSRRSVSLKDCNNKAFEDKIFIFNDITIL